jgi:hypothetical protein
VTAAGHGQRSKTRVGRIVELKDCSLLPGLRLAFSEDEASP